MTKHKGKIRKWTLELGARPGSNPTMRGLPLSKTVTGRARLPSTIYRKNVPAKIRDVYYITKFIAE